MKKLNENMINAVGLWSPNFISCNMASPSESGSRLPASAAITSASMDCSPKWRPNSYLFQIQRHQIHSHYLCHYHFFKNFLVRQSYTPQNFLDFEPFTRRRRRHFVSHTAMTMHIPLGCLIHGIIIICKAIHQMAAHTLEETDAKE